MASLNYNCTALGSHEKTVCGNYKVGGINAIAIVEGDHTISDPSSASDWSTNVSNGKVTLIEDIKAQIPEPSAIEGENPIGAAAENILDAFDYEITYKDFNVNSNNEDFYNALNERRFYVAVFHEEDNEITWNGTYECTAVARAVTPEMLSEKRHYLVTIRFRGKEILPTYTAPAGIFNQ